MTADSLDRIITEQRKAHPGEDHDRTAERVQMVILGREDALALVGPAIRDYVLNRCRSDVRQVERKVYNEGTDVLASDARTQLLAEGFPLAGGWVPWATASVEQIEGRIAELEKMRDDLDLSIATYRQRAEEMRKAGVKRWGDLSKSRARRRAA